jgi:hypothetical protein
MSKPITIPGKAPAASHAQNVSSSYAFHASGSSAASGATNNSSNSQMSTSAPQFQRTYEDDVSTSPAYMKTVRFSSGFLWDENILSPGKSYMRPGRSVAEQAAQIRDEVQVAEIKLLDDEADNLLPS